MNIVVDDSVALAREAFAPLGDLTLLPAARIDRLALQHVDALVVRSGVRVGAGLLDGTPVRFVATATSGADHVDEPWLAARRIAFASAAGSNARAVAEYVIAALFSLERSAISRGGSLWPRRLGDEVTGRPPLTLGVVGVGHVGREVVRLARALGLTPLLCDPPRAAAEPPGPARFLPLPELLAAADVVTLHVPLTGAGPHPTRRLIDAAALQHLRTGAVLVNTARGDVADSAALIAARQSGRLAALVCDVWSGEPADDPALHAAADCITPHIAGYSRRAMLRGTWQAAEALARWSGAAAVPPMPVEPPRPLPPAATLADVVLAACDPSADARAYQSHRAASPSAGAAPFTTFRRTYDHRPEFADFRPRLDGPVARLAPVCAALGFSA